MIKRFAVEIYFLLFALCIIFSLAEMAVAIRHDALIGSRPGWLLVVAVVFAICALVATEVRDRTLYNEQ